MNTAAHFTIQNITAFKIQMLNWANRFNIFCLLDNQQYAFDEPAFECLLAAGSKANITVQADGTAFQQLQSFAQANQGWIFGHLGYDLKNETEQLQSNHFDGVQFPDAHFFVPEVILQLKGHLLSIHSDTAADEIFSAINACSQVLNKVNGVAPVIRSRISQATYMDAVRQLQAHILRGDCYEVNYCQEFYAEAAAIDPLRVYHQLNSISPNPFSALYRLNDRYCICASPERYFKKAGSKVISQPIKGTAGRHHNNVMADQLSKRQLQESEKEKSENVMVVDLARNDLSRICKEGTVKVDELFGIYAFPQVYQMISTISGELDKEKNWVDIVRATFPMASMTGAPKKRVMELIEQYEYSKRGLFSGSIGYIRPDGNADFNVVIRSILHNAEARYLSFHAGSAITYASDAGLEYQECLLKTAAIRLALQ